MKAINPKNGQAIKVAMKSPEDAVPLPAPGKAGSFSAMLADLKPGESCSKVVDITQPYVENSSMGETFLNEARERLRSNNAPLIARAKLKTFGTYSQEVTQVVMATGRLFLLAIITRYD